jgi:predicted ATP-grasp superfamily ATP-dependent carboligase
MDTDPAPATLVVAGLGVRALAESAHQGGWSVLALDLFGDRDTRRASAGWRAIGTPSDWRIDPGALTEGLRAAARVPGVIGWVPGGGFEDAPALLEAGPAGLSCLGATAATMRRVRDPHAFFGALDAFGLPHPPVVYAPPERPEGWLAKRGGGSSGLHVVEAALAAAEGGGAPADRYFQREQPGTPMSALFVADGTHAVIVALNRQLVAAQDTRRYVYAGALGPIVAPDLEEQAARALAALVPEFGVRGLGSLDFVADSRDRAWLLELNPRPSATMALHPDAWTGGLMRAHVNAVAGRLPDLPPRRRPGVRANRIVFAERDCEVDASLSDALAASTHCHDVPAAGERFAAGAPVCTVSADAASADDALRMLATRAALVRARLVPDGAPHAELAA